MSWDLQLQDAETERKQPEEPQHKPGEREQGSLNVFSGKKRNDIWTQFNKTTLSSQANNFLF